MIGTRHDSHAELAAAALRAGKAVFVEKPLGLTGSEIDDVWAAAADNRGWRSASTVLSRRCRRSCGELDAVDGPIQLVYRVNAPLPRDHWLNDPDVGGGRILGEACHMFDYANWLLGAPLRVFAAALPRRPTVARSTPSASRSTYDGGHATVHYTAPAPARCRRSGSRSSAAAAPGCSTTSSA